VEAEDEEAVEVRAHVGSAPGRREGAFESSCSDASTEEGMIKPEEEVENEDEEEDDDADEDKDDDEEDSADAVDISGRLPTRLGTDLVADKDDDADGIRSSTLRMCALVCAEYDGASCGRESSEDARR
jgi:hypothetical protein